MNDPEDFLAHYGKLGMKWGRRTAPSSENLAVRDLRRKSASSLTDSELKQAIGRMKLEKQYKDLNPKGLSRGYKVVLGVLALATTANTAYAFKDTPVGKAVVKQVQRAFKFVKNK